MAQDVAVNSWNAKATVPILDVSAPQLQVKLKASATYAMGQILGPVTASPGVYAIYASGNTDGSEVAELVLPRACKTDASGLISFSDATTGNDQGRLLQQTHAYVKGAFKVSELTGLDATAVTAMKGKLVAGGNILIF